MRTCTPLALLAVTVAAGLALAGPPRPLEQEPNTWVKRSPTKDGPVSPGMGYEASLAYDPAAKLVLRWAGHNQGGGGEQNAELWAYDPVTSRFALREPSTSPPGVCCAQQNVFDDAGGRFLRFAGFSGNHGWQWFREIYLNNSSVWAYHPPTNTWRDLRTVPAPRMASLRCAAYDSEHQVVVVFGGEGSNEGTLVYDPYTNVWTRMSPPKQPAGRSGGNLAYDAANKLHILFGSQFTDDPHTWAYDLRKNAWRDMRPPTQPPTDRNDAVLAYDANSRKVVAVVRAIDKLAGKEIAGGHVQTWAYDAAANEWTKMSPPREPDGWHNRRRIAVAVPDQNVILMEHYANPNDRIPGVDREQQMWTYRLAATKADPRPLPPTGLRVETDEAGATLTWQPSATAGVSRYVVYRGAGDKPWQTEFKEVGRTEKGKTIFDDRKLDPRTVYHYHVSALDGDGRASAASVKVRTQPRLIEDVVVSALSEREVLITWPAGAKDVTGYLVERAPVEVFSEDEVVRLRTDTPPLAEPSVGAVKAIGAFVPLTEAPVRGTSFTDRTVNLTKPAKVEGKPLHTHRFGAKQLNEKGTPYRYAVYAYRVRAVNALGVRGGDGPYALTIPSAPQWLFAREDGEKCHLKWAENPERGVRGYRVYRIEGPRINGPGQKVTRLTPDVVERPRWTHERAGKDAQRYHVVAVDALGQEGYPSAPAWHYRQYRKFYEPFVGAWHQ